MFEIEKKTPEKPVAFVDSTKGLACPQASELPHSLMDEYQALLMSSQRIQLKQVNLDVIGDSYAIPENSNTSLFSISIKHGASPNDLSSVESLFSKDIFRNDHFQDGVRDGARFLSSQSTKSKYILVEAQTKNEGGRERITSESGYITELSTIDRITGRFDATFDGNGKLVTYKAGPDSASMVDEIKSCTHK
jgi:hypothetical protein